MTPRGLLPDVHCGRHLEGIIRLFERPDRREFWDSLGLECLSFSDVDLVETDSDRVIWDTCQQEKIILVTANRNADGPDSLERCIADSSAAETLPVVTFADATRFLRDRDYAERTADCLLERLFDIKLYLGAGRIYIP